ncbi:hypothetical protein [uncultured Adlercreutzia sp.]|uniref:hypothetical protein n=1 Tax=uncultured Adlercreutzia sp. TaxID=875803 RepID=UPI0025D3E09B|nr:hypothetical protein [uncultured Adlercreutzia sp.]
MKSRKTLLSVGTFAATVALALAVGCTPQAASSGGEASSAQDEDAPVAQADFTWNEESDCATCHSTEGDSTSDDACLASTHAAAGASCVSCHDDSEGLAKAHEGASLDSTPAKRLKTTEVSSETCLASDCHNTTLEELAALTTDCTIFTDDNGTVVNPHEAPDLTPSHVEAEMTCTDCHNAHEEASEENYQKVCSSCHHAGVYECGTCHAE